MILTIETFCLTIEIERHISILMIAFFQYLHLYVFLYKKKCNIVLLIN